MGLFDWVKKQTKTLFDQKQIPQDLDSRNPDTKRVQGVLADWITKYLPGFEPGKPYGGNLSASMSPYESTGMQYLSKYLQGPDYTGLLQQAGDEVSKTLSGNYDPSTSQFYKAARDTAAQNQTDAITQLNQGLGASGKFFSSERVRGMSDIGTKTTNYLNNILGQLSENERNRMLQVLPEARAINQDVMNAPIKKITAATTFGALPRELEQQNYERQYQEFVRQQQEKALPITAASAYPTNNPLSYQAYDQSPFQKYIKPLMSTAMMAGIF